MAPPYSRLQEVGRELFQRPTPRAWSGHDLLLRDTAQALSAGLVHATQGVCRHIGDAWNLLGDQRSVRSSCIHHKRAFETLSMREKFVFSSQARACNTRQTKNHVSHQNHARNTLKTRWPKFVRPSSVLTKLCEYELFRNTTSACLKHSPVKKLVYAVKETRRVVSLVDASRAEERRVKEVRAAQEEILQPQLAKARAAANALGGDPAFAKQAADLQGEIARLGTPRGQKSLWIERENKRVVQLQEDVETAQAALIAEEAALAVEKLELQKLTDEWWLEALAGTRWIWNLALTALTRMRRNSRKGSWICSVCLTATVPRE